jgi:hypothetical protein
MKTSILLSSLLLVATVVSFSLQAVTLTNKTGQTLTVSTPATKGFGLAKPQTVAPDAVIGIRPGAENIVVHIAVK